MSIRNRELSQFGSFIYIDDATKTVGIATTATPYVGIGTTNASHKLTVVGNTNLNGNVDISGNTNITGIVTATKFYGDGSTLNNVTAIVVDGWIFNSSGIHTLSNVGIGTTNPTEKLTVSGDISATGIITSAGTITSGIVTASRFVSTVSSGTAPLTVNSTTLVTNLNADLIQGRTPPVGDFVGSSDSQTLTNKTLQSPVINGTGLQISGSTSGITTLSAQLVASGTILLPAISGIGTVVTTADVGTITSGMIANSSIVNADIAVGAGITYGKLSLTNSLVNADIAVGAGITYGKLSLTNSLVNADISATAAIANSKLANSTISGVSLGSDLNALSLGTYLSYTAGTTYNGSTARTLNISASNTYSAGTSNIVARDSSGNFSAGTITATLSGTATNATNVNLTSGASTSNFVIFSEAATGNQPLKTDAGLTYNASTNILGASISGTATNATNVTLTASTTASAFKVPFANTTVSTTGNYGLLQDSTATFTYNPSTNTLTCGTFSGALFGNADTATNATTAGTADALNISNNYRVNSFGVGTNASGTAGEIRATSNITAYYSDDRLKTKLGNIENALEKVCSLNGFYYEANEVAQKLGYKVKREVGVSAQEVEKILPEIVTGAPIDEQYKTIYYDKLIPLLIESIKELREEVKILKEKLGEN